MGALRAVLPAMILVAGSPAKADGVDRWAPYIDQAAQRCGIPATWIAKVMHAESAGMTVWNGRPITSRTGAMGLMQLMPATWAQMRGALDLGADPYDPRDNILAGACYLRAMFDRFGYPGLFGAYNAGPGRYGSYLGGRQSLPGETRTYLATVTGGLAPFAGGSPGVVEARGTAPTNNLFFALRPQPGDLTPVSRITSAGLFVALRTTGASK